MLTDDALRRVADGTIVRVGLPWIRSLPLWCITDVALAVDDRWLDPPSVCLEKGRVGVEALSGSDGWWFIQDRLVLHAPIRLAAGAHRVTVSIGIVVPYLILPSGNPLARTFTFERALVADAARSGIAGDVS